MWADAGASMMDSRMTEIYSRLSVQKWKDTVCSIPPVSMGLAVQ